MSSQLSLLEIKPTTEETPLASKQFAPIVFSSKPIPDELRENIEKAVVSVSPEGWCLDAAQMSRGGYTLFKELITSLKGRWNGKTHLFQYDPSHRIQECLDAGKFPKNNPYSLHETPALDADFMVEWADLPQSGEVTVLEPSAGTGALIKAVLRHNPDAKVTAWEVDPFNREILAAQFPSIELSGVDWLKEECDTKFDFVLMNPEFRGDAYVKHIEKAIRNLKPGGVLLSIVPESFNRKGKKSVDNLRNYVSARGQWEDIGRSFASTNAHCLMLKLRNLSPTEIAEYMGPTSDGFDSTPHRSWEIAFSCEQEWDKCKADCVGLGQDNQRKKLADLAESIVSSKYQENVAIPWTNEIKAQCIDSAVLDVAENYGA